MASDAQGLAGDTWVPGAGAGEVLFRPVRTGNSLEETVERLLGAVKLGVVRVGERLPAERELAARLEISRMTLREAIRALQTAGYVESRRGRHGGTFVVARSGTDEVDGLPRASTATPEGLADALTFRDVVEVGAASNAARRPTPDGERAHLLRRLEECDTAALADYRQADSRLHLAIAEATGSPSVVAAVADARMRVNDLLDRIPRITANLHHANEQHRAVVVAVLADDELGARTAMCEHLAGTAALLRGFLT